MLIAVDFDNTLVCYDALFARAASELGLVPAGLPATKHAVRDHLRATGRETLWTELQGEIYGPRMAAAVPFPGAREFFLAAHAAGVRLVIVSHKTRHPCRGQPHDLHAAAHAWLEHHGFYDPAGIGLTRDDVHFEPTRAAKLARIAACGATHCLDDLPEVFAEPAFPASVTRLHFAPDPASPPLPGVTALAGWPEAQVALLHRSPEAALLRLGLAATGPAAPVAGGANNRVRRQRLADGRRVLVKQYAPPAPEAPDRFLHERAFYRYLALVGVTDTPAPLGWDELARVGVLTWIEGAPPIDIGDAQVAAALDFVLALNTGRGRPEAATLPAAAEACFSPATLAATLGRRLAAVATLPGDDAPAADARAFVRDELLPAWEDLRPLWQAETGPAAWSRLLPPAERCLSPSDFGFHNCLLRPDSRLVFFDFEYAGWDDPAKLFADFYCQPDRPAPAAGAAAFVDGLATLLPAAARPAFAARCAWLRPVYAVKWAAILLNDFTVPGRARREFSLGPEAARARRARQLARARAALAPARLVPAVLAPA